MAYSSRANFSIIYKSFVIAKSCKELTSGLEKSIFKNYFTKAVQTVLCQ